MAWLDSFRQAKFRNVEFHVPSAENSGGRRLAVHEFIKQDVPYPEDMGGRAKRYNIEAYIIGEDYFDDRDSLRDALDKEGAGILVHPYLGTLRVSVANYTFREVVSEGRMVRFTITFIQAGELVSPQEIVDTRNDVTIKKLSALDIAKSAFEKVYTIAQVPYTVSQNAITTIDNGLSLLGNAKKTVSAVSDFVRDLENAQGKVIQMAYDVADLADEISDLMSFGTLSSDDFPATADNARYQIFEMKDMWDYEPEEVLTEESPSEEFSSFYQNIAVINALGLISVMEFDSFEESEKLEKLVFDKLETILLTVTDDDLYLSLYELKTAVSKDIDQRGKNLPRLAEIVPNVSLPAIVHSWDLYSTIDEEQDIVDRNKIRHPGMVPGGVSMEIKITV